MQILIETRLKELENDPIQLSAYAKCGCRHCLGKGYLLRRLRYGQSPAWFEQREICQCVIKNLKKEIKEIGSDNSQ